MVTYAQQWRKTGIRVEKRIGEIHVDGSLALDIGPGSTGCVEREREREREKREKEMSAAEKNNFISGEKISQVGMFGTLYRLPTS